jgi:hypothetical protein
MKILHACAPRPGKEGKTFWHRVGTAFVKEDGKIGLLFDSLPLPDKDGRVNVQLFEPKPKDSEATQSGAASAQSGQDMDDEIPF